MDATLHRIIPNDFVSLHQLMEDATQFLERSEIDAKTVYLINLGIEEIVTNIIKYGYDTPGTYQIEVTLHIAAEIVTLLIIDDGHEFNPVLQKKKQPAAKIEDREIGGLGIDLLKKMFEKMDYQRDGRRNVLHLTARRQVAQPAA